MALRGICTGDEWKEIGLLASIHVCVTATLREQEEQEKRREEKRVDFMNEINV